MPSVVDSPKNTTSAVQLTDTVDEMTDDEVEAMLGRLSSEDLDS
jgi:hypothetical protein